MTIDIYTHLEKSCDRIDEMTRQGLPEAVDTLISRMDEFGIRRAVLSPLGTGVPTELYMEAARLRPDRLMAACSVPPRPIHVAREKLKMFVREGAVALTLHESLFWPEDPAVMSIVNCAVRLNIPVFFDFTNINNGQLRLIDSLTVTFPEGRFVLLHMGGLFGFPRVTSLLGRENLWFEVSSTLVRLVESPLRVFLDAVSQDIGIGRLVFGSEHNSDYEHLLAALNTLDLNVETQQMILEKNAFRILGPSSDSEGPEVRSSGPN